MAEKILLLHEKALRYRFDFDQTLNDFKAIHIWDDAYYRMQRYSFKRLVFIYETLLELPLEIIHGNTLDVLKAQNVEQIVIPQTGDQALTNLFKEIEKIKTVQYLSETPFVPIDRTFQFKRFFKYWNQAKKTAFLNNGNLCA